MTSNWTSGLKILSMGVNSIHPLDGIDQEQSTKSIVSILSTPIASALHQKSALRTQPVVQSKSGFCIPVVSEANIPSLYPRQERSDYSINWFAG